MKSSDIAELKRKLDRGEEVTREDLIRSGVVAVVSEREFQLYRKVQELAEAWGAKIARWRQ